jgi:hypothetical protein
MLGRMSRNWLWLVMMTWLLALEQRAAAEQVLFADDFSGGLSNGWQNVAFFKARTDYQVRREGTNCLVQAVAQGTCSALSRKLDLTPSARLILRWRWRVEGVATNGSERELSRFDHAARIFLAFDTLVGPPRTLNYLWANVEPVGAVLAHPKSGRAELFVVESGNDRAGRWLAEERDVTADWERAFPGKRMPKVVGVGMMTDSDSLGGRLAGEYADLRLVAR